MNEKPLVVNGGWPGTVAAERQRVGNTADGIPPAQSPTVGEEPIGTMVTARTTKSIEDITDLFSGADGGAGFYNFLSRVKSIEADAEKGDLAARDLINVVNRFASLMRLLSK